jgi:ferric-dicitrate binding protein FerR (iron transport regulator)
VHVTVPDELDARLPSFGSRAKPRASVFCSRAHPRASTGARADPLASTDSPRESVALLARANALLDWPRARQRWALFSSLGLNGVCLIALGWPHHAAVPYPPPMAVPQTQRAALVVPSAPAPATPPLMYLEDGSTVQLRDPSSRVHSEASSETQLRMRLSGGARFDVLPDHERSFVVANAQVLVRSLGSTFSVDPQGTRTLVAVERGRAQVMWRSGATILNAGEAATFPPEDEPAFGPAKPVQLSAPGKHAKHKRHAKRAQRHAKAHAR